MSSGMYWAVLADTITDGSEMIVDVSYPSLTIVATVTPTGANTNRFYIYTTIHTPHTHTPTYTPT